MFCDPLLNENSKMVDILIAVWIGQVLLDFLYWWLFHEYRVS